MRLTLPDPAATLQAREIERLADFLYAKVIGQGPMDRAKCIDYWGSDVNVCADLPRWTADAYASRHSNRSFSMPRLALFRCPRRSRV